MTINLPQDIDRLNEILRELEGVKACLLKRLSRDDAISQGHVVDLGTGAKILEDELEKAGRQLKTINGELERLRLAHET